MLRWIVGGILALVGVLALAAVAGYFILKRPDIPYETLAAKYESGASRYELFADGVRLHYRDEGNPDGPTLLLLHGFSASLQTWEPWVQQLGGEYRLITLDLPGHGLTRAPAGYLGSIEAFRDAVAIFVEARGLQHFVIGGNSMGGHVALEYALAHPEHADALMLIDSAGWPEPPGADESQGPIIFQLLRNPVAAGILRDLDNSSLIRQGLETAFPAKPELVDDSMVARYAELSRAPGHRDIVLGLMRDHANRPMATPERLAALTMPTLIVHGNLDRLTPLSFGEQFHAAIAGSEFQPLDGIGHVPQEEVPEQSAALVRVFVQRVYSAGAEATLQ